MTMHQPDLFDISTAPATSYIKKEEGAGAGAVAARSNQTQARVNYIQQAINNGFNDGAIARALGITQSAVTQLKAEYGLVPQRKAAAYNGLDNLFDEIELNAATKLKQSLACTDLDPMRLTSILSKLNNLKRRSMGESPQGAGNQALVKINLPEHFTSKAKIEVVLSSQNEVVAIQGRQIATMPSNRIEKLVNSLPSLQSPTSEMPEVFSSNITQKD